MRRPGDRRVRESSLLRLLREARLGSERRRCFFEVCFAPSADAASAGAWDTATATASAAAASAAERQGAFPDTSAASQSELRCDSSGAVPLAACRGAASAPTAGAATASPDGAPVSSLTSARCAGVPAVGSAGICCATGEGAGFDTKLVTFPCCAGRTLNTVSSGAALLTRRPFQLLFDLSGLCGSLPHRVGSLPHRIICLSVGLACVCCSGAGAGPLSGVLRSEPLQREALRARAATAASSTCSGAADAGGAPSPTRGGLSAGSGGTVRKAAEPGSDRSGAGGVASGSAAPLPGCDAAAEPAC